VAGIEAGAKANVDPAIGNSPAGAEGLGRNFSKCVASDELKLDGISSLYDQELRDEDVVLYDQSVCVLCEQGRRYKQE